MSDSLSFYRPNVGVVLFNAQGLVWVGRRATSGEAGLGHPWQFPQGGVDEGEDLYDAARRELAEETGVVSTSLLGRTENWITYDFPPGYAGSKAAKGWRGQKQIWFALRFEGHEDEIRLDHHHQVEFTAWRWARLDETPDLIVPFKRPAYEAVARAFAKYSKPA